MSRPKSADKKGREIAMCRLVEGKILIGETITVDAVVPQISPRRQVLRGMIFDIRDDLAYMCILGHSEIIAICLEPVPA